jgi:hypothetical protein
VGEAAQAEWETQPMSVLLRCPECRGAFNAASIDRNAPRYPVTAECPDCFAQIEIGARNDLERLHLAGQKAINGIRTLAKQDAARAAEAAAASRSPTVQTRRRRSIENVDEDSPVWIAYYTAAREELYQQNKGCFFGWDLDLDKLHEEHEWGEPAQVLRLNVVDLEQWIPRKELEGLLEPPNGQLPGSIDRLILSNDFKSIYPGWLLRFRDWVDRRMIHRRMDRIGALAQRSRK